jgi:hypothetical protein
MSEVGMVRQQNTRGARATPILIGLATVYAALAIIAKLFYSDNNFIQTLLLSLGSATLGSGMAFFLIDRGLEQVRAKRLSSKGVLMGLTLALTALVLLARVLFVSSAFVYTLLLSTGAVIFASGLTFFLVARAFGDTVMDS